SGHGARHDLMSAAKPGGPSLSTVKPVFSPCLPAARPDPQRSARAFNAPTQKPVTFTGPFSARFGAPQMVRISGTEALHPLPLRPAEWSIRSPLGTTGGDSKHTRAEQIEN